MKSNIMKKYIFLFVLLFSFSNIFSQDSDPAYNKAFGWGVIIASGKGYPSFDKYDPTIFEFKNGKFYVPGGENATIDLRVFSPKGTSDGTFVEKLKKAETEKVKTWKTDYTVWQLWVSHDLEGNELVTSNKPWPKKVTDIPTWAAPILSLRNNFDDADSYTWNTSGCKWVDYFKTMLKPYLSVAKPGYKFYVNYAVGFDYVAGVGEETFVDRETKEKKIVKVDIIKQVVGEPIASCTIEVK